MAQIRNGRWETPRGEEARPSPRLGEYLRRLREGYGYTLRKVEEKTAALGEPIDNSQLSRFEKGKALPSFEKLRALARIFNVSVQQFSDVLDLEEYEPLKPHDAGYEQALRLGEERFARGEHGGAFAAFERAVELAAVEAEGGAVEGAERVAEARWRLAAALKSLGKLAMTERELREVLKVRERLPRRSRIRTLLQLAFVYRELDDLYLAELLARESLDLALEEGDRAAQASVLNTLGNLYEPTDAERALSFYERSAALFDELGTAHEEPALVVATNLGGCLVKVRRFEEGVAMLERAHGRARDRAFRRVAALSLTRLAEAWLQRGRHDRAGRLLDDADALASAPSGPYHDILFLNAYHRWTMARETLHPTREKIAFGRLRHLRARIERRFPEVDAFDRHVERSRREAR
jgi:transcriptional regulator with XRE-family HTH domain